MDAVLVSINPKWCKLIASGEKTIEVRKTRPRKTPFKAYIYCTKGGPALFCRPSQRIGNGKVIEEFVCDQIFNIEYEKDEGYSENYTPLGFSDCLDDETFDRYLGGKNGYGWHISELKIYDEPKGLFEFMKPCNPDPDGIPLCLQCKRLVENYGCGGTILRPPQSWMYVEEVLV